MIFMCRFFRMFLRIILWDNSISTYFTFIMYFNIDRFIIFSTGSNLKVFRAIVYSVLWRISFKDLVPIIRVSFIHVSLFLPLLLLLSFCKFFISILCYVLLSVPLHEVSQLLLLLLFVP